jgi:hypothetical protein
MDKVLAFAVGATGGFCLGVGLRYRGVVLPIGMVPARLGLEDSSEAASVSSLNRARILE